jgi:hypothetical protein
LATFGPKKVAEKVAELHTTVPNQVDAVTGTEEKG